MDTDNSTAGEGDSSQEASSNENKELTADASPECVTMEEEDTASISAHDVAIDTDLANLVTNLEIPDESNNINKSNQHVHNMTTEVTETGEENLEGTGECEKETITIDVPEVESRQSEVEETQPQETTEPEATEKQPGDEKQQSNVEATNPEGEKVQPESEERQSEAETEQVNAEKTAEGDSDMNKEVEEPMEVDQGKMVESEELQTNDEHSKNISDDNNDRSTIELQTSSQASGNKDTTSMVVDEVLNSESDKSKDVGTEIAENSIDISVDNDDNAVDSTEFMNTDTDKGNKDKETTEQQSEKDPIASESLSNSSENKTTEGDDSILPDTCKTIEETNKPNQVASSSENNELYIVTKTNEKTPCFCMECGKNAIPIYKCSYDSNTLFICTENCLKVLKEKKPEKVIVRDLRVKIFASEGLRNAMPLIPPEPEVTVRDCLLPRCGSCNVLAKPSNVAWNSFNFCNEVCLSTYQKRIGTKCIQCKSDISEAIVGRYSVRFGKDIKQFCKNSCLLEHKKGQKFCTLCQGEIDRTKEYRNYCSVKCYDMHSGVKKTKTGMCSVCMNQRDLEIQVDDDGKTQWFCSDPCFVAYKFVSKKDPVQCELCKIYKVSDSIISFFYNGVKHLLCSLECRKLYIIMTRRIVHCAWCNVKKYNFDMLQFQRENSYSILCSLNCYYLYRSGCDYCHKDTKPLFHITTVDGKVHNFCSAICLSLFKDGLTENPLEDESSTDTAGEAITNGTDTQPPAPPQLRPVKKIVVVRPRPIPQQRNITTMCKPYQITKSINCKPKDVSKGCQTDAFCNKFLLPIPVPIFVPIPACMYSLPVPCPLPIPVPVPVPIFIPTARKSIKGIIKEMNKIKNKVPADPLEAELLMMAEMVAEDKKEESDSESEDEPITAKVEAYTSEPEQMDTNNSFGEDVLQMALKMASDFEEPVDLEGSVSAATIPSGATDDSAQRIGDIMETKRRSIRQARQGKKKTPQTQQVFQPTMPQSELEKADTNLCLKFTFGVNAWKQWVTTKNLELQKGGKRNKLFKTEILQLTSDELNYSLCLFVKEVRKPNGAEYAPDTIYYLCLGIQQYLYESGRVDNIFCDTFYEKFTDCLNEVCQKFSLLYNESQYIVTRVEEEHLWESKQLGAHSPLVLLNTLMFFNTKHFSLTTVAEHLQLSFSHIMKHWKRNPNQPGSRNVLLRFYLPQTAEGSRKKKVYEQQENENNPLRCPVKLYEFYLSKCPESVKTRNDVFYLQPERSCVPDSPVWYSTMALGQDSLEKMLNRVKMVKEINVAILTT